MEKVLENPNLDPIVRAKLIEEMLKNVDGLSAEEKQKLFDKMLENSDQLGRMLFLFRLNRISKLSFL